MTEAENASYLARRQWILEVLEGLIGHWELAEGLSALIGSDFVTLELIDSVEKILQDAIKTVSDSALVEKLQAWVDKIQQLKEAEKNELTNERNTIDLDILKNFI